MSETEFDLISIGDSTIDVFMEIDKGDTRMIPDDDGVGEWVALESGSKVGVKKKTRVAAVGNSANNAIGSSRLGLRTAIYTHVGDDKDGEEILEVFKDEGVSTDFVSVDKGKKSNFSTVINYGAERVIFVFHEHREYGLPSLPSVPWAYYSSSAEGHEILHGGINEYVKNNNIKLGFNPGTFQLSEGLEGMKDILEVTHVLLLNRQEAHKLVGGDESDTKALQKGLMEKGPKNVVITDARNGTFATDGKQYLHAGIPEESPVVERTGAGDAFSTGCIAALAKGKDLSEALIWGTLSSTSVVQYIGAREGLLTEEGMEEIKNKWGKDFGVEEF